MKFQTLTGFIVGKQAEYPGASGELTLLLNECNPVAFLAEQAGGKATDGFRCILDIQRKELHKCSPIFVGPTPMVEKTEEFMDCYSKDFRVEWMGIGDWRWVLGDGSFALCNLCNRLYT